MIATNCQSCGTELTAEKSADHRCDVLTVHSPEPSPDAPVAPAVVRRRRRRWTVALVAVVAVLGVAGGLVVWAPWASPPLLRPTGLTAGTSTSSSVTFRWSRPATGPAPDRYMIFNDGKVVDSVRGTVTQYQQAGLAPATVYRYSVTAVRGGKRSARSPALVVSTVTPPMSAARWQGPLTVNIKIVRGGATLSGPRNLSESWLSRPKCAAGACSVVLSGSIAGHRFKVTLARSGARYIGTTTASLFPCGSGSNSFPIETTMRFQIKLATAQPKNRAWVASSWSGTMVLSSPYTASGAYYCVAASVTTSLSGNS